MDAATLMPAENGQHLTITEYNLNDNYEERTNSPHSPTPHRLGSHARAS